MNIAQTLPLVVVVTAFALRFYLSKNIGSAQSRV